MLSAKPIPPVKISNAKQGGEREKEAERFSTVQLRGMAETIKRLTIIGGRMVNREVNTFH